LPVFFGKTSASEDIPQPQERKVEGFPFSGDIMILQPGASQSNQSVDYMLSRWLPIIGSNLTPDEYREQADRRKQQELYAGGGYAAESKPKTPVPVFMVNAAPAPAPAGLTRSQIVGLIDERVQNLMLNQLGGLLRAMGVQFKEGAE
jgi:hypothetical protein